MMAKWFLACLTLSVVSGCIPDHLKKYQTNSRNNKSVAATAEPAADLAPSRPVTPVAAVQKERPSIYAIDEKTFRFAIGSEDVWNAAINVLMRNYNLTIVDKESGIVTTEWDTFYLDQQVLRNKVSMRVQRNSRSSTDIMIHNSVERLESGSPSGAVGAVWLPAEDSAEEVHRIVRNMAILLNQPPPFIPGGNVATRSYQPEGSN